MNNTLEQKQFEFEAIYDRAKGVRQRLAMAENKLQALCYAVLGSYPEEAPTNSDKKAPDSYVEKLRHEIEEQQYYAGKIDGLIDRLASEFGQQHDPELQGQKIGDIASGGAIRGHQA